MRGLEYASVMICSLRRGWRAGLVALACLAVPAVADTTVQQAGTAPRRLAVDRLGPQVGARVPAFSLPDQGGRQRTLASLMGPRGLMLVFSRSADW